MKEMPRAAHAFFEKAEQAFAAATFADDDGNRGCEVRRDVIVEPGQGERVFRAVTDPVWLKGDAPQEGGGKACRGLASGHCRLSNWVP